LPRDLAEPWGRKPVARRSGSEERRAGRLG